MSEPSPAPRPSGFAFADAALDRAASVRTDPAELARLAARPDARLLAVRRDGRIPIDPRTERLGTLPAGSFDAPTFLGLAAGAPWFAGALPADAPPPAGLRWTDLRAAAATLPATESALAAYARALLHWQSRKRWCGVCGAPTRLADGGHRARCSDEACAAQYFPRTDPAIIVVVDDGAGRVLLGRQPAWPPTRYSTLAGFVEPGESLEAAVCREVAEETGIVLTRVDYLASQPWPFPASLMLGFRGTARGGEPVVGSELADARWFAAESLPELIASGALMLPPALSISYHLIDHWYYTRTGAHLEPGPVVSTR